MNFNRRHRQGFTLIEVLVASLILGITVAAISQVMGTGIRAWRNGHGVSEVGQTVRIAQDMIMRDLDNIYYQTESNYNRAFYTQIGGMAGRFGAMFNMDKNLNGLQNAINEALTGRGKHGGKKIKRLDGQGDALDDFSLESIAPPLNLSLHGGEANLSFARGYRARYPGDQDTWGLRRVTYYVRDKVLYRKEEAPFGLRMAGGGDTAAAAAAADPNNPVTLIQSQLQQLFAVRDEAPQEAPGTGGEAGQQDSESTGNSLLPTAVRLDEPLCAGVEIFKIKYGFFTNGNWVEDQTWDSAARQHRCPPQDDINGPNSSTNPLNRPDLPQFIAQSIQATMLPDDLPGYVAIQIGLRQPNGKGRLYSFTIYHSMPGAREVDIARDDRGTGGIRK